MLRRPLLLFALLFFPASSSLADATGPIQLLRLPAGEELSSGNAFVDEGTVAIPAARLALQMGEVSQKEGKTLVEDLKGAYAELRQEHPRFPSPLSHTFRDQQTPAAFDLLVIPPKVDTHPREAVVFLHGYGGSFTLQCWLLARAASRAGALTVCPAISKKGDWWNPAGEATLRETLAWLKKRGRDRVILAGLSNGSAGATVLARRLSSQLRGLVAIAGVRGAGPRDLPTFLLSGERDSMAKLANAQRFAKARPERRLETLPGGHFAFLRERDAAEELLFAWFTRQYARR